MRSSLIIEFRGIAPPVQSVLPSLSARCSISVYIKRMYIELNPKGRVRGVLVALLVGVLVFNATLVAAGGGAEDNEAGASIDSGADSTGSGLIGPRGERFPAAPEVPEGPLSQQNRQALDQIRVAIETGELEAPMILQLKMIFQDG